MLTGARKIRLGDLLLDSGDIDQSQLETALAAQKESGTRLGRILVDLGYIHEDRLLGLLAEQLGVPFVQLEDVDLDPEVVQLLPETHARRYRAIVLEHHGESVLVGMVDPIDIFAYDEVARLLDLPMNVAVIRDADLNTALDVAYHRADEIGNIASELDGELTIDEFQATAAPKDEGATPVGRLLQTILDDARTKRASDVHIEPDDGVLRLRTRVDGVLQEQLLPEVRIAPALVSRLKLMAGLDISEKRLPQDGRFDYDAEGVTLNIRLSTLPTTHGESVVLRLVDPVEGERQLDALGLDDDLLRRVRRLLGVPNGLILVTGPTGSGKTTTLYGALRELNSTERKIITVEDPVEIQLERVNQVQVNTKIGLDFGKVLRSALRQDPDILLVGEIRDLETAEIAVRSAMTGHLVLSTLHTNDAVSSAMRLLDIGVPGYMVASSVRAIIAQRLVRRICEDCKTPHELEEMEKDWLLAVNPAMAETRFYHGEGCNKCNHTGYRGRFGVFELLEIRGELTEALRLGDNDKFVLAAREQRGFRPLAERALIAAEDGATTLGEAMALSNQEDERGNQADGGLREKLAARQQNFDIDRPH